MAMHGKGAAVCDNVPRRSAQQSISKEKPMRTRVKKGQIWADNDKRSKGRTLEVISVWKKHVFCEVLTLVGGGQPGLHDRKETRIRLDRMWPCSTGYRLIKDVEEN